MQVRFVTIKKMFQKLKYVLRNRKGNFRYNEKVLNCYATSMFLCDRECSTVYIQVSRKYETTEMCFYSMRTGRPLWVEQVTNKEDREK